MSVEVTVPQLGESIVEATVGQWMKREGDTVTAGELLVSLETDKVNMEVAASDSGILESIVKHEGDTVAIGEVLAVVGEGNTSTPSAAPAPAQSRPTLPPNGIPAAAPTPPAPAASTTPAAPAASDRTEPAYATPLAQRMAAEHGIDVHLVAGTGPGGRIGHDDVAAYVNARGNGNAATAVAAPASPSRIALPPAPQPPAPSRGPQPPLSPPLSPPITSRHEERIRMSRRRQTIARRLVEAQHNAAMLTTFNEVDMSAIMALRSRRRDAFKERHGIGLGFMSFFTRAVIGALKAYPRLNAEIQGDEMILKRYYDIGIAVGVDEGLVVPVVRDADKLTFAEIEQHIADLAVKARKNALSLDELQGGTFTITNGGTFGSLLSTPILNAPQVGILGMHKIEERPIAVQGQVVIRPMMYLALSYDHRIVDGSEAVRFLVRVKELLEDPETLLLEG